MLRMGEGAKHSSVKKKKPEAKSQETRDQSEMRDVTFKAETSKQHKLVAGR